MPAAAIVTLILATLIVAAAALGLARVVLHLVATMRSLDAVIDVVGTVADRTRTVPVVLPNVNRELRPVREFADTL